MREPAVIRKSAWLALASVVAFSAACQPPAEATMSGQKVPAVPVAAGGKSDQSAQEPLYRRHPSPRLGYDVALSVAGAPGPFQRASWKANYQAAGCSYVTSAWAGTRAQPTVQIDLPFRYADQGVLLATVYLDAFLDEDYGDSGTCRWQLLSVSADIAARDEPDDVGFFIRLDESALKAGSPSKRYYPHALYAQKEKDLSAYSSTGVADPTELRPELREDLFSITLMAKKLP